MINTERVRYWVNQCGLQMKLIDVRLIESNKVLLVEYTAKGRVDFRQLLTELHREFNCRIQMKQISVREHEQRLNAGVACGRRICFIPLCQTSKHSVCYTEESNRNEND